MKQFLVYWYHLSAHKDPHKEGYVGVTTQSEIRHRCHKHGRSGGSRVLAKAFTKYGEENILRDVLHAVDSKEEAYELEMAYRPFPRTGWNLASGGGLPPDNTGRVVSTKTRMKMSESAKKAKAGKTYISPFKGVVGRYSDEQRQAIGIVHRGKTISEAHKKSASEKNSGDNSFHAKEVFLVHVGKPEKVHHFSCIKTAAIDLNIPYNTLRSQAQRTLRHDRTSEPSRTGWICLSRQDSQNSVAAVLLTIKSRTARFQKMTDEREASRKLKVLV